MGCISFLVNKLQLINYKLLKKKWKLFNSI